MAINTLYDFYTSQGQSLPSVADRTSVASKAGISNYAGTADQNNTLLAYLQKGSTNTGSAIPVDGLSTPTPKVPNVTAPPVDNTSHSSLMTNTGLSIGANAGVLAPTVTPTNGDTKTNDSADLYNKLLTAIQPPSGADTYNADTTAAGIDSKQNDVNTASKAVTDSQAKLATLNANLNAITANGTATKLSVTGEGRGKTLGIISGEQAQIDKQTAIQAIPVQTQILGAQAEVAAAQGNEKLAQSILSQAQDHVDKVFQIQTNDATQKYNYQKDIIEKYMTVADASQKEELAAAQKAADQKFTLQTNNLNNAQSIAATAIQSGQADIAAKITQLDPTSPTFTKDLAKLEGQIKPKATTATQSDKDQAVINNANSQLTKAKGTDGYTDPNLYARIRSASGISPTEFDNRFAYLVNPASRAKLGLTNAQAGNTPIVGNFTPTQTQSLIGSGIPSGQLDSIATYVSQYGLQAALTNSDMTTAQKNALKAIYGQ